MWYTFVILPVDQVTHLLLMDDQEKDIDAQFIEILEEGAQEIEKLQDEQNELIREFFAVADEEKNKELREDIEDQSV